MCFRVSFIFAQQFSIWFHWMLLYVLWNFLLLHNVCKFVFYTSFKDKIRLRVSCVYCAIFGHVNSWSITLRTAQGFSELNLIAVRRNDFCYNPCYTMFGSSSCRRYSSTCLVFHQGDGKHCRWRSWVWTTFFSSLHLEDLELEPGDGLCFLKSLFDLYSLLHLQWVTGSLG